MKYKELLKEIQKCEWEIAKLTERLKELNKCMETMPENLSVKEGIKDSAVASKLSNCNGFKEMNELRNHFKNFKTFKNLRGIGEKSNRIILESLGMEE